jgi:peptidyl-prolyl cis-trans isomerase B (cyclophilin B)
MKTRLIITVLAALTAATTGCRTIKPEAPEKAPAPAAVVPAPQERNTMILIKTSHGDIKAELFAKEAPDSVKNFLQYVTDKHFDGTIFHRVMPGFMIQGGGFSADFRQKATRAPVKNEAGNGLKNKRGTLALARTSDVHSATSQFFINLVDNGFLDFKNASDAGFGYCVFGKVTEGMDVVDKIATVKTGQRGPHGDVPVDNVVIQSIAQID